MKKKVEFLAYQIINKLLCFIIAKWNILSYLTNKPKKINNRFFSFINW